MSIRLLASVKGLRVGPAKVLEGGRKVTVSAASRKAVLFLISFYARDDGVCWPGQDTLAAELEMSRRTVRRALASLETDGVIERDFRHRRNGFRTSDEIRIAMPQGATVAETTGHVCTTTGHYGRAESLVDLSVDLTTPARAGREEGGTMNTIADACNDGLASSGRPHPPTSPASSTGPKAKPKLNAHVLAQRFRADALIAQYGHPHPVEVKQLAGQFADWHRNGVEYDEIRMAQRLFWREYKDQELRAAAGDIFTSQKARWIEAARDEIAERQRPQRQAEAAALEEQKELDLRAKDPDPEPNGGPEMQEWIKRNFLGGRFLCTEDRLELVQWLPIVREAGNDWQRATFELALRAGYTRPLRSHLEWLAIRLLETGVAS